MDESEVVEVDNMECDVCGERTFQEREGYYYCIECGTKKEQIRAVEISAEDTFNDTSKHASQRTIKKPKIKAEETDITSWEFYNYVLRGFLQELLQMGAKPELKLMTLQVWAAYMRRMEVAFCTNNELGLPKLNVRALSRDAHIIYNHKQNKRKRERREKNLNSEAGDERSNWREWRKTKRKLDESGYSVKDGGVSVSSQPTLGLKLEWSTNARKSLKRKMPLKHLDKHSVDSSGSMFCHKLIPKASTLTNFDRNIYCLNITKLYLVLAIALNQVEDEIQLTDLLRLIDEEHLTSRYMLSYLPEDVAMHGKKLVKEMEFGHQEDKCRYKFMRLQIALMSRFIDINGFQQPNLKELTKRYVLELGLPSDLADYVVSLINICPPTFETVCGQYTYPQYEARVMAYIIYVLKLFFGLDDVKERAISESAIVINEVLLQSNDNAETNEMEPLFVYTEWMEFVEMRKIFVAHYNESFAKRFGVTTRNGRKIDDFLRKENKQKDQEYNHNEMFLTPAMQRIRDNINIIFETYLKQRFGESGIESATKDHIEFQPSLTPAHSYFNRILLHVARAQNDHLSINIPECMRVDHSVRQLAPFKNQTTKLAQHFAARGQQLRVEELACQTDYEEVGLFQKLSRLNPLHTELRANLDVKSQEWIDSVRRKEKRPDFIFLQPVANYGKQYQKKLKERTMRRQALEVGNPFCKSRPTPNYILNVNNEEIPLNDIAAIQIFNEDSMGTLHVPLENPRRLLGSVQDNSSSVEEEEQLHEQEQTNDEKQQVKKEEILLKISKFDCWLLHGWLLKIREADKQKLRSLFPHSFRWLLETCAATIGVDWAIVYEQLLVVEVMFHHGIDDWSNYQNHLSFKYNYVNKYISALTKHYRDMW